ncbi:SPFH domain-containing protein [Pelomonas sp. KK5]|uniref:SPFH domain-containing protein n=1 Tax=Pelomonas sp. KK5 TaxID=1855730 RepID=UPI00097BA942|nr:SPFH domain-containing protein [Pelomonas sp. KK5]
MDTFSAFVSAYYGWFIGLLALLLLLKCGKWLLGIYVVPDDSIGTVVKKFVLFGEHRELPPGKIVALHGEAGIQAATLAPGLHWGLWPWQYKIAIVRQLMIPAGEIGLVESCDGQALPDGRIVGRQVDCDNFQDALAFLAGGGERGAQMALLSPGTWRINPLVFKVTPAPMTVVGAGMIGVVEARDGRPLAEGRVIGRQVACDSFQDARAFIEGGGERGPQMTIVPQGTYRINPMLFKVELAEVTDVPEGRIGIVTTREGRPLATGEIAGPEVPGHNLFQDPQRFVDAGGNKGLQEQVLLSGRYFINPKFATVEMVEQTNVPIANVGVVVAYVGREGRDVTGADFRHGNLVARGEKGVWVEPLDPGMYPINPHTHKVRIVPTANVVLNWATGRTEAHNLDAKLSTIKVRSSDGFSYNLDVSQIIHIPRNDAPRVIARFGSMDALVTQVLEPTIGNYFRNAAQKSDVIDFLSSRSERQAEAKAAIAAALAQYNVGAVETLIGDINPPEELMKPLTERKVAETQKATFVTQQQAQTERQKLEQAKALADTQPQVVAAERKVAIARFDAEAAVHAAEGQARSKTINAEADARVTRVNGEADATVIRQVGEAEAAVIQLKTNAVGAGNYAGIQIAEAFGRAGTKLVPEVMVAGGAAGAGGGGIVDALLGSMLARRDLAGH